MKSFFACFKPPEVKENTSANTKKDILDKKLLTDLNNTLSMYGLYVSQFNKHNSKLASILQSIPPQVCNKEYLNEILESPIFSNQIGTNAYLLLVSKQSNITGCNEIVAICYYEVSQTNCTIHLVCNMYRSDEIKVGEALINFVINSVSSTVKTISLVAETEEAVFHKLVNYYKKFGFTEISGISSNDGIQKQRLEMKTNRNSQSGGISKDFIKYNNRKYLVRVDDKKKRFIISKGTRIYINTIKYTKM